MLSTDPRYPARRKLSMKVGAGVFILLILLGLIIGAKDKTIGIKAGLIAGAILGLTFGGGLMQNIAPKPDDFQ